MNTGTYFVVSSIPESPLKNATSLVSQEKPFYKRFRIRGCGGTGAIIADHLGRAGVGRFTLVDGAHLDAPDLNRQWTYTRDDIGAKKVDLLATHLQTKFNAQVKTFHRQLKNPEDLTDLAEDSGDLIVCAADQSRFVIEHLVLDLADINNTPVVFGSVGITDDLIGPVLNGPSEREVERQRLLQEETLGIDINIARGSLCFTNTLAAAKIGLTAYRFLLGLPIALSTVTPA